MRIATETERWGNTPLHFAIGHASLSVITELLAAGADINKTTSVGNAPLHLAINRSHYAAIVKLLSAGADIHKLDGTGKSALRHAIGKLFIPLSISACAAILFSIIVDVCKNH